MNNLINLFGKSDTKIIEELSLNDRSIVAFYNGELKQYMILFFHVVNQPNEVSRQSIYSTWGYVTGGVNNIYSEKELKQLTEIYVNDILSGNTWWESDET